MRDRWEERRGRVGDASVQGSFGRRRVRPAGDHADAGGRVEPRGWFSQAKDEISARLGDPAASNRRRRDGGR